MRYKYLSGGLSEEGGVLGDEQPGLCSLGSTLSVENNVRFGKGRNSLGLFDPLQGSSRWISCNVRG